MKISKTKLRQIIKEEISQVSEGFIEDPFDDGDGMINRLLGLRWGKMPNSNEFMNEILSLIRNKARKESKDPRQVAEEEIAIMRQELEKLMGNIERKIDSFFPRGTQTQSQALTRPPAPE